jgi:hypothetical protein
MTQYDPYDDDDDRKVRPAGNDPRSADPRYADPRYADSRPSQDYYDPGVEPDLREGDQGYDYGRYEYRQETRQDYRQPRAGGNSGGSYRQSRPGPRRRRRRLIGPVVAVAGLLLFFATVWFAYSKGGGSGDGTTPLIRADHTPMKMRPDDPGGMDVPHQDKDVYKLLGGNDPRPDSKTVERLLPPPETPLPRPEPPAPAVEAPTAERSPAGIPDLPALATGPTVPLTHTAPDPATAPPPVAAAPPQPQPTPARPSATAPTRLAPPVPIAPTPAATPRPASPPQVAAVPPAPPPVSASGSGGWRIQVASLTSNDQARAEMDRLQKRYSDALGGVALSVIRADLGDKGVRYRVQTGPVDENRAKSICNTLKAQNVGCLLVRP